MLAFFYILQLCKLCYQITNIKSLMLYNHDIKTIHTCKFDKELYQKTMLAFFSIIRLLNMVYLGVIAGIKC